MRHSIYPSRRSPFTTRSRVGRTTGRPIRGSPRSRALVRGIKEDLSIDWADHEATEAAIRVKIKRLLRRYKFEAHKGGRGADRVVDVLLDQARELYRFWPDVPQAELPI